jgi:hypothetical protein
MSDFPGRVERHERLLAALATVEAEVEFFRSQPGHDPHLQARYGAAMQLAAIREFLGPDTQARFLENLRVALSEISHGRSVDWLEPRPERKGRPGPSDEVRSLRGRYLNAMNLMIKEGGVSPREAAKFVAKHGNPKRLIEIRKNAAKPHDALISWKKIAEADSQSPEAIGARAARIIAIEGAPTKQEVEAVVKQLVRALDKIPISAR